MVRRLVRGGHQCVVSDLSPQNVAELTKEGATGSASLDDFAAKLNKPRAAWVMVPAGAPTEDTIARLGGNTCATIRDRFEMLTPTLAEYQEAPSPPEK